MTQTKRTVISVPPPATSPASRSRIQVSTQMTCAGPITTQVFTVPAPSGYARESTHVGIQIGRTLIYIEDPVALAQIVKVVRQAERAGRHVFSSPPDAFDDVEAAARRRFERTGNANVL